VAAIIYEVLRRREDRKKKERQDQLLYEETQDSRLKKEEKKSFRIPRSIYVILFLIIVGIFGFNQLVKNGLYGSECVTAAESAKKLKFSDQLKLLQQNVDTVDEKSLEGGELGGNKDYGDIFGDPNLFKDFGGFDTKED
jgi:hypothetical protein